MADVTDKAREEFFSEVQEIIESLSRDLLSLDAMHRRGDVDPETINDIFRAIHTLKGLAGLFGASRMSTLSHDLEDILDDLRLGRRKLTDELFDLMFRAVDVYGQILIHEKGVEKADKTAMDAVEAFLTRLAAIAREGGTATESHEAYDLDPGILAVLTEYEEHRLRTNVASGFQLYRIRASFRLATIDADLEQLKVRAKPLGEIITYLPTGGGDDIESLELEILMASRTPEAKLIAELARDLVTIEAVARRATVAPPPGPPPTPSPDAAPSSQKLSIPDPRPSSSVTPVKEADEEAVVRGNEAGVSLRSVSQTVRVDIRKLDHLMNLVGELAIVRSSMSRLTERVREGNASTRDIAFELERLHRGFDRHLAQMQEGILEVRMVPIGQIFDKLGRVVRQASREAGKQINLVITGAETEVDKLIVEELSDPLMHMIRNAIDHGIEPRSDRLALGKPEVGTIAINAFQKGSHVLIEIEDDGHGIDPARLIATAVERGMMSEEEGREVPRLEAFQLIFVPGFTTKKEADMLAGRGMGMDIVKTNISRLGGVVDVASETGIGTKMTVTLPITLAILSALVVHAAGEAFAIPLATIQEALAFDNREVRLVEGREIMTLRGQTLPLTRLARLLQLDEPKLGGRGKGFVVVVSLGARRLGLVVDHLEGQQDIVIKSLGPSLRGVSGFAGAAELGDQRVGLVLDVPALVEEVLAAADVGKAAILGRREHNA